MTSEDIKALMKSGEVAQASEACEAILKEYPDDLEVKMLYGTCRQLLGDTATFQRIHDELAPALDSLEAHGDESCVVDQWRNYKKAIRYLTAAGLVFAASAFLCGCYGVPQYDARNNQNQPHPTVQQIGTGSNSPSSEIPRRGAETQSNASNRSNPPSH